MSEIMKVTAEAIVTGLNAHSFDNENGFTATREYDPKFDLREMSGCYVTVVPREMVVTRTARSLVQRQFTIDIAVQKKLTVGDNDEIDELVLLMDDIGGYIRNVGQFGPEKAVVTKTEMSELSRDMLREMRVFTAVTTCTFIAVQAVTA